MCEGLTEASLTGGLSVSEVFRVFKNPVTTVAV